MNGTIEVDRIAIVFFNKVMAYGISITGEPGDTLASVNKLSITVSPSDFLRGKIRINRIFIEDGCFNLVKEGPDGYSNINRIFNTFPKPDSLKKPFRIPDMEVGALILRNMAFSLVNLTADTVQPAEGCINFQNLRLENIDARINRVEIVDNSISCRIRDLSCTDRCGYELRSLSGTFSLNGSESRLDNMHLTDNWSEINAEYLSFGYSSGKDLKDFINKVHMGADFRNSTLDFRSIGTFAQSLRENTLRIDLNGQVNGTVSALKAYDLEITTDTGSDIGISAEITGLPDIRNTYFNFSIKHITTTTEDISDIICQFSRNSNTIGEIMPGIQITMTGLAYGNLSSLYSLGTVTSDIGAITYEVDMDSDAGTEGRTISSDIELHKLNIGEIINKGAFGDIDLKARILAELPDRQSGERLKARLEHAQISSVNINGYEYKDIAITGEMMNGSADIRLLSHDPAFPVMFQSIVNIRRDNKPDRIKLYLDVPYSDLLSMNLVKTGTLASAGITAKADLQFTDQSILGSVLLDNISYANDNGQYNIDSIYIRSYLSENEHTITMRSPIIQAGYTSTDSPARLAERLGQAVNCPSLERLLPRDTFDHTARNGFYDFHLKTFDMSQICDIIMPGLYIADGTSIDMTLDESNLLDFKFRSSSIAFRNKKGSSYGLDNVLLSAGNMNSDVKASLSIDRIQSGNMTVDNTIMSLIEDGKDLLFELSYNNADTTWLDLSARINAWKDPAGKILADIAIDSSGLNIRNHIWDLSPTSVYIRPGNYSIRGFGLYSPQDTLRIYGTISDAPDSVLSIRLANLNLDLLNSFTGSDIGIQGRLSGEVDLFNFFSGMGANMEITGDSISLKGENLGQFSVLSRRDLARNRFNILINNFIDGKNPVNASGYFIPGRNYLDVDLLLRDLHLKAISPFFSDFATISDGYISGNIDITGQLDMLMLSSNDSYIDSLAIIPSYTNVPYIMDGPVTLSRQRIELDSLSIKDPHGSTAWLSGTMTHDFFRNIYIDANLGFQNFQVLNTREYNNSKFYGTAFASGRIGISGPTNNMVIDAQVSTNDKTSLHVPLSSSSSASTTDLITFADFRIPEDSTSSYNEDGEYDNVTRKRKSNVEIRATAGITSGTELQIEIDRQLGDILKCRGDGNISLTFNPSRNIMDIRGDYTVSEGSLHYTLYMQSRDFTLNEGGSIAFNGDLKNTNLNIGATYHTKASISTLISDTTAVGSRRNVSCGIQLQGPLANPELSFSIDIPDLDPITKGRVESALSTPDKVQKQFMALLFSGSFVPDEQSGIVNNSTILYSNASEMLSNQFNNIFRQLDIPLDLGLNYQPGGSNGSWGMFDVAVSYQAFNNRLIINGNLGNDETSSNWAGDFDAEIKVDRQGKLRVTLFTRSADTYSNYLDNTQRSGFGVTYQDEFDTFGDFWRNIFFSRKRREQYELQKLQEAEDELEKEAAAANIVKEEVLRPRENPMNFLEETGTVEYQEDQDQGVQVYYYEEEEDKSNNGVKAE